MIKARFVGVNHYHNGEPLEEGEIVELTDEQYDQWSYQFERLDEPSTNEESEETVATEDDSDEGSDDTSEDDDPEGSEDSEGEDDVEPPIEPSEYTISELQSALEDSDYSDAELVALYDAEIAGEDRTGAKDVISESREG